MSFNKTKILFIALCFVVSSCSSDKKPLEGQRIEALNGETFVKPDYVGNFKISFPEGVKNLVWYQAGGNSEHIMPPLKSDGKFERRWSTNIGEGTSDGEYLSAQPVVANKVVFAIDADAVVTAVRLDNGKKIWKKKLTPANKYQKDATMKGAGIAVSPFQKRVFATTGFGGVYALDMVTGKKIWHYDAEMPIRISPTIGGGMVMFQTMDNSLIALDSTSGTELWRFKTIGESTVLVGGANPAYSSKRDVLVAAFSTGELKAFKASTGSPLWSDFLYTKNRINSNANINSIKSNPVIDGEIVYAAGSNNIIVALDLRTGTRIWEKEIGSTNPIYVAGNTLFILSNRLELIALNKKNGDVVWSTRISAGKDLEKMVGAFAAGPLLIDDKLLVGTSNGYVFAANPYTGKLIASTKLDDGVEISPIAAEEYIIFTTNDADLVAYR